MPTVFASPEDQAAVQGTVVSGNVVGSDVGYKLSTDEAREPQVQSELGYLDGAIEQLGMVTEQLEQRLRLVLRDEVNKEGRLSEPDTVLVPQAERIKGQRNHINAMAARLRELLDRIEI